MSNMKVHMLCSTMVLKGLWVYHYPLNFSQTPFVTSLREEVTKTQNTVGSETQFLPGNSCIDTTIWMHYLDAN